MTWEIWTIYVFTVLALMSTPGPSQLLILSNSAAHGFKKSLFTAWGDLSANFLQMLAAGLGLATILTASASALTVIKWAGVAYLLWLGVKMIVKAKPGAAQTGGAQNTASRRSLWFQGFLTSAANPKAIVFFAALFPQFIAADASFVPQFAILSATYIALDALFLSTYAYGAGWIARKFTGTTRMWVERAGGGFMILAAVLLGAKTLGEK